MKTEHFSIQISDSLGSVSAILMHANNPKAIFVMAHGAGAGMHHHFMEKAATKLAENGISTLRYQFPYTEKGKKRPDPPGIAVATVRAVVKEGKTIAGDQLLLAGGKSYGGRMTSHAAAEGKIDVDGIVFLGFPLHAPGKPSVTRAEHLYNIQTPMLFLQGTRDSLADLDLISQLVLDLDSLAAIQILEGGDHSFKTRKSDGILEDEMFSWLANCINKFVDSLAAG